MKKICVKLSLACLVILATAWGFTAHAATLNDPQIEIITEEQAAPAAEEKKQIIDFNDIIEDSGVVKEYFFLSAAAPTETLKIEKKELGEIIDDRTEYSKKFFDPTTKRYFLKINQEPVFKTKDGWFFVERATTTLKDWNAQARHGIINIANAATISPFSTADGWTSYATDDGWADTRNAITGTDYSAANLLCSTEYSAPEWAIARSYLTFNTGDIPDTGYKVNTARIFLRGYDKGGSAGSAITGAAAYGTLGLADYSAANNTLMSNVIAYASFSTTSYNTFTLNAAGTSSINILGNSYFSWREYTHDILNSAPVSLHDFYARSSAYTGTAQDPYLVVSYSVIPTSTPPVITSATTTTNILEFVKWTKNGTTYYYFPAFHLFFIILVLVVCLFALTKKIRKK